MKKWETEEKANKIVTDISVDASSSSQQLHQLPHCCLCNSALFVQPQKRRDVLTSAEEEDGGTKGGFHSVGSVFVWFIEEPRDTRGKSNRPSKARRGAECWHAAGLDSLHTFEHNPD